jgi:hypothetical protein
MLCKMGTANPSGAFCRLGSSRVETYHDDHGRSRRFHYESMHDEKRVFSGIFER